MILSAEQLHGLIASIRDRQIAVVEAVGARAISLQLTPGEQVQAEVIARLPTGQSLANIAGQTFSLPLPPEVKPGETVRLTFLSGEPRLTFALSQGERQGTASTVSDRRSRTGTGLPSMRKVFDTRSTTREPGADMWSARCRRAGAVMGFREPRRTRRAAGPTRPADRLERRQRLLQEGGPRPGAEVEVVADVAVIEQEPLLELETGELAFRAGYRLLEGGADAAA